MYRGFINEVNALAAEIIEPSSLEEAVHPVDKLIAVYRKDGQTRQVLDMMKSNVEKLGLGKMQAKKYYEAMAIYKGDPKASKAKAYLDKVHSKLKEESLEEAEGESKAAEIIKELIDTSWGGSNDDQGKAVQLLKGLAFSDDPASNKFMKKLDAFTSSLKPEDFS